VAHVAAAAGSSQLAPLSARRRSSSASSGSASGVASAIAAAAAAAAAASPAAASPAAAAPLRSGAGVGHALPDVAEVEEPAEDTPLVGKGEGAARRRGR